jgi:conjugal transfer/entry exclusion protein
MEKLLDKINELSNRISRLEVLVQSMDTRYSNYTASSYQCSPTIEKNNDTKEGTIVC